MLKIYATYKITYFQDNARSWKIIDLSIRVQNIYKISTLKI